MAYRTHPAAESGSAPADIEETIKQTAATALSADADDLVFVCHVAAARGGNGISVSVGSGGGAAWGTDAYVLSANGASSFALAEFGNTISTTRPAVIRTGGVKWWTGAYYKINTAIHASSSIGVGAFSTSGTQEVVVGVRGAVSTTNFHMYGAAGTAIDSGVAIDTAYHLHEGYRDGTNSYYRIDGGTPVSGDARPNANAGPGAICNDNSSTLRELYLVWMAAAWVKP